MEQDIRWLQRYDSFHRANKRIQDITESDKKADDLSELEMEGLIQRFEYTFELGWKVLQDLLKYKGYEFVQGPNGTLQKAFEDGLIADHDGWRRMAKARVPLHTLTMKVMPLKSSVIYMMSIPICCSDWMINSMKKSYGLK